MKRILLIANLIFFAAIQVQGQKKCSCCILKDYNDSVLSLHCELDTINKSFYYSISSNLLYDTIYFPERFLYEVDITKNSKIYDIFNPSNYNMSTDIPATLVMITLPPKINYRGEMHYKKKFKDWTDIKMVNVFKKFTFTFCYFVGNGKNLPNNDEYKSKTMLSWSMDLAERLDFNSFDEKIIKKPAHKKAK